MQDSAQDICTLGRVIVEFNNALILFNSSNSFKHCLSRKRRIHKCLSIDAKLLDSNYEAIFTISYDRSSDPNNKVAIFIDNNHPSYG